MARAPVSLVEVQGYLYAAWRESAKLLCLLGEEARAETLERRADDLRSRFEHAFYVDPLNYYALAIDRDGRVETVASNPGHLLFTGIVADASRRRAIADCLLDQDTYSGWGVRTLAASERAYNPIDYQVGAVWPHDNSLIALGLQQCGFRSEFEQIFTGIFEAATLLPMMRLPEVLDGFARSDYPRPVPYPVSCSPQAWAAGSLPLMLSSALGLASRRSESAALDSRRAPSVVARARACSTAAHRRAPCRHLVST